MRHGLPEIVRAFKTFSAPHINVARGTAGLPAPPQGDACASAPTNSAGEGKNHDCKPSSHALESQSHVLEWRDFDNTLVSRVFGETIRVLKSPRYTPELE